MLLLFLALRWFRIHVMWSVRNRLIVTYLFIGALPVGLMAAMAMGSGYVVLQHLATFLTVSEIRGQASAWRPPILRRSRRCSGMRQHPGKDCRPATLLFPEESILVMPATTAPAWLKPGFTGLVFDHGKIYLRAAHSLATARGAAMVVSTVPFDQKLLARIANKLGSLTLEQNAARQESISAGSVPEAKRGFDREFRFGGLDSIHGLGNRRVTAQFVSLAAVRGFPLSWPIFLSRCPCGAQRVGIVPGGRRP